MDAIYQPVPISLGGLVTLTNVGTAYDGIAAAKGLGCAMIDFTGVKVIDFTVRYNKVAAGASTVSFQLWNDTDGTQIMVMDDASAAGDNKVLTATITTGIPTGIKRVRVRAKSTVAADDPVYYGGCILLR